MRCPHCQSTIPDGTGPCPVCGRPVASRPDEGILEPELVGHDPAPGQGRPTPGWNAEENPQSLGFTRIFYTSFPAGNGIPSGCYPTIITLALALAAGVSYGLLASIGFLVFAAIGRAVTFTLTVKSLMSGRAVNPWVFHILSWAFCWFLVAWLSGNV